MQCYLSGGGVLNREWVSMMKQILANLIEHKMCSTCDANWFKFWNNDETIGYYRLGEQPPSDCPICSPLDSEIESDPEFVSSSENWVSL